MNAIDIIKGYNEGTIKVESKRIKKWIQEFNGLEEERKDIMKYSSILWKIDELDKIGKREGAILYYIEKYWKE